MSGRASHAGSDISGGFLGLPEESRKRDSARVIVLPVPYEATVSYETGTREGPRAIILASQQVELYDADFDSEPALAYGIHTLPAMTAIATARDMGERVAEAAESALREGKLLVSLGGEHGITPPLVRGVRGVIRDPLTVVQIDAHADLRDSYDGDRNSHACAMRRVLDENPGPAVQVGIRSLCTEEAAFIRANRGRLTVMTADAIHQQDSLDFLHRLKSAVKGSLVYLTIDVDGLDPSIIPATGTPEPGGLTWKETVDIVATVAESSRVVALDCVELSPRSGLHSSDFTVAKLLYKAVSRIMRFR